MSASPQSCSWPVRSYAHQSISKKLHCTLLVTLHYTKHYNDHQNHRITPQSHQSPRIQILPEMNILQVGLPLFLVKKNIFQHVYVQYCTVQCTVQYLGYYIFAIVAAVRSGTLLYLLMRACTVQYSTVSDSTCKLTVQYSAVQCTVYSTLSDSTCTLVLTCRGHTFTT